MPPPFTLWREVAVAYLAPALTAGAAGIATGQSDLAIAAVTSIAGTSALVATLVGTWLQRGGRPRPWTLAAPKVLLIAALALVAGILGAAAGLSAEWIPAHTAVPDAAWLTRLRIDLPLSAALAATIITWRWRGVWRRTPTHHRSEGA
ncbi:hypothetical protein [Embleya sp. NBC_00896]|uniref:hypothetical protein n=1 Tax=Embleya sp. NBC_00896 TaxID=2975961 RepID=UPI002F90ED57|nr:hypothetical protein OG928_35020 [Embleya sp. NBC_00896]